MYRRVVRLRDGNEVAGLVAERLLDRIVALQLARGLVHVCLTGGQIANLMYERFADLVPDSDLEPGKLQLWWGDDRFVPANDPDRNSLQALTRLARTLPLSSSHAHPMPAQEGRLDAHQAAAEYAADLGQTAFDILLLGIGPDGHVGSIFPNHQSFEATPLSVIGVTQSPKPPSERITLTLPTMNRAQQIWFMASGGSKADAVARTLDGDLALPAAHVRGREATLWFIDQEAAAGLPAPYTCSL